MKIDGMIVFTVQVGSGNMFVFIEDKEDAPTEESLRDLWGKGLPVPVPVWAIIRMQFHQDLATKTLSPMALNMDDIDYAKPGTREFSFAGMNLVAFNLSDVGERIARNHIKEIKESRMLVKPVKGKLPKDEMTQAHFAEMAKIQEKLRTGKGGIIT